MKNIVVGKRREITSQNDAENGRRRFRCERCFDEATNKHVDDFEVVFPSSQHPAFIKVYS